MVWKEKERSELEFWTSFICSFSHVHTNILRKSMSLYPPFPATSQIVWQTGLYSHGDLIKKDPFLPHPQRPV